MTCPNDRETAPNDREHTAKRRDLGMKSIAWAARIVRSSAAGKLVRDTSLRHFEPLRHHILTL